MQGLRLRFRISCRRQPLQRIHVFFDGIAFYPEIASADPGVADEIDGSRPVIPDVASRIFQRKLVRRIAPALADIIGIHGKSVISRDDRLCKAAFRPRTVIYVQQMSAASDLHLICCMCSMQRQYPVLGIHPDTHVRPFSSSCLKTGAYNNAQI